MEKPKVGYCFYNVILIIAAIFLIPYFIVRNLLLRRPVLPYFQLPNEAELAKIEGKSVIWLQAVSVGETVVAKVILEELQKFLPDYAFVFTTTTPTGQAMAKKILGDHVCIAYFPFDLPILITRFLKMIQPKLFLLIETEVWPNAIRYAKESGCKVAMVNGMISDRSFKRYQHFSSFLKEVFSHFDLLAMQSAESANRVGRLGAPLGKILVTGNSKFDQDYPEITQEQIDNFFLQYGWNQDTLIFTAASTHRGEEAIVIDAYLNLIKDEPYNLIIAPRHPERAEEVMGLLKEKNLSFVRRSAGASGQAAPVLLLDTFGEFGLAYAAADVIFVGGSLVNIGGHNILEAAVQAKPVIYGPYMHKTRPSKQLLEEADAGFTVRDTAELVNMIMELTADSALYRKRSASARAAVLSNKGTAAKTAGLVAALVGEDCQN